VTYLVVVVNGRESSALGTDRCPMEGHSGVREGQVAWSNAGDLVVFGRISINDVQEKRPFHHEK